MAERDDLRQFIRDTIARHERVWRAQHEEIIRQFDEMRALREAQEEHDRETRAEHEAQRQALLHILDRLQNGGAAA